MNEFYRHLRPIWLDKNRMEITNYRFGGVSFLVLPLGENTYNYWIYVCPENILFSTKAAVAKLKTIKKSNVIPWGTVVGNEQEMLLETLCKDAINNPLQKDVGKKLKSILKNNHVMYSAYSILKEENSKFLEEYRGETY